MYKISLSPTTPLKKLRMANGGDSTKLDTAGSGVSPSRTGAPATTGGPAAVAATANGPSSQQQQQQYTIPMDSVDKQLLAASGAGGKQCEIHHSILQHDQRPNSSASQLHRLQHQLQIHRQEQQQQKSSKKRVNSCRAWLNKFPSRSKRIDVISRIFFPKMFALFNLVYWTTYLFREDDIVRQ